VFEVMESYHQSSRDSWPANTFSVERTELLIEVGPFNLLGKLA